MAIFVQEIMNAFLKGNTWIFVTSEEQILCNFYVMFLEFSEKTALKISTICLNTTHYQYSSAFFAWFQVK